MLKERLKSLLIVRDSPHRIALAFAMGVMVGISPLLGIHTVLGLVMASIFRLNRVVTLTGVYVTNPWTIVPIYAFSTWVGAIMLGADISANAVDWHNIGLATIGKELEALLFPFIAGSSTVAVAASVLSYFIVRKIIGKSRSHSSIAHPEADA